MPGDGRFLGPRDGAMSVLSQPMKPDKMIGSTSGLLRSTIKVPSTNETFPLVNLDAFTAHGAHKPHVTR